MYLFLPSLVPISPVSHDLCASTTLFPSPITCSLPRLTAKMGEGEINRFKKELEEENKKEEELENEITQMRKERNKCRMGEHTKKEQPEEKKRKLEDSCEAE